MFKKNLILQKQFTNLIPKPGKTGLDWFFFCYFLNKFKNKSMLEIGAGNGGSSYTMFAFSDTLTIVDSWDFGWAKDIVDGHLNSINCRAKFVYKRSENIAPGDLEHYNFIHLDANKGYNGTLQDLILSSKCCTGIICVDDYMNSVWPEVTWAVDDFVCRHPAWRKIFISNHQIFLSNTVVKMQELIVDFPLVNRQDTWYLTYGELPEYVDVFIENGKMTHSWHKLVWGGNKEKL